MPFSPILVCLFQTVVVGSLCSLPAVLAAAEAPPTPAPFQPEDISIGEPISLPFATPLATPAPGRQPNTPVAATPPAQPFQPPLPGTLPTAVPGEPPGFVAGNGWLGIAVDDTVITGRLVVVEVAPNGPAAKAGIKPQDVLLAINGNQLQNGDELAAALAAITPGQRVKIAVGRENRVDDVLAEASIRPPEALSRDWQSALPEPTALPQPTKGQPVLPPSAIAVPAPPLALAPAAVVAPNSIVPAPPAEPPSAITTSVLASAPWPNQTMTETSPALLPPPASPAVQSRVATGRTALGVRTVPVDPNVQSRFRLSAAQGAFVVGVVQDLPASRAGLPPGSVIVAINHQPVRSPQDLSQLVASGPVGTPVSLNYVLPGGELKQADVVLQALELPLEQALVGDGGAAAIVPPPALQPTPLTTRRVQSAVALQSPEPQPLVRLEELLRRMNARLEQMDRRLERLESGR
ncbi:MAG: PDZ domain-containing protein [Planctomycetota bacterium]